MIDVLIIGGGPAGLTAALYALRAGVKVTVIENNVYGGQVVNTPDIENYPGFEKIGGAELAMKMYNQVVKNGAIFVFEEIQSVDLTSDIKKVKTALNVFEAKSVIIANGLKRRKLGCIGEEKFTGRGVSFCAVCDGAFFKDKNIIVVGGGNSALDDAIYLSKLCNSVTIVIRRNVFRGDRQLVDIINKTPNIFVKTECHLKEIKGEKTVTSVILEYKTFKEEIPVSGVFIAIGFQPQNELFKEQVSMDKNGYFNSDENCTTNIPGIFVAGDCRLKQLRQIVTAVADGAVAGNSAAKFANV